MLQNFSIFAHNKIILPVLALPTRRKKKTPVEAINI